jgi:hypothetical protein
MKEVIEKTLERYADRQCNLASEAARGELAHKIYQDIIANAVSYLPEENRQGNVHVLLVTTQIKAATLEDGTRETVQRVCHDAVVHSGNF